MVDYWEGRWKQEYAEKIELLHKNIELKKKYGGITEEVLAAAQINTFTETLGKDQRIKNAKARVKAFQARKRNTSSSTYEKSKEKVMPSKEQKVNHSPYPPWTLGALGNFCGRQIGQEESSREGQKVASHVSCGYCGKTNHTKDNCW